MPVEEGGGRGRRARRQNTNPPPGSSGSSGSNPFVIDEGTEEEEEEQEQEYYPGGPGFLVDDEFAPDPFDWADTVNSVLVKDFAAWGEAMGYSSAIIGQMYGRIAPNMFDAINSQLFADAQRERRNHEMAGGTPNASRAGMGAQYYMETPQGINEMINWARNWMSVQTGVDLTKFSGGGGRGRGRGGGGRGGPTAEEIRNQFDLAELANGVTDMYRGILLDEPKDAKKLAREYVDAVVAVKAEKKIDFEAFIRERIEKTARFKSIYVNKPKSMSAEQYIAPYLSAALQMTSPEEAESVAIGAAQFGASPEQMRSRLQRTDAVSGSAPFIAGLEQRMQGLRNLFKG